MKVFAVEERVAPAYADFVPREYDFFRSICKPYDLCGKTYNCYPRTNMQIMTTLRCNAQCGFCIEKSDARNDEIDNAAYLKKLSIGLENIASSGLKPSVTITGGEPTLNKDRLRGIIMLLREYGIEKFGVNTNGVGLIDPELRAFFREQKMPYLNISRHHYDEEINRKLMGGCRIISNRQIAEIVSDLRETTRVRLQCVLDKSGVHDMAGIKKYLEFTANVGCEYIALREISEIGSYNDGDLIRYVAVNRTPLSGVLDALLKDPDFRFICQNTSDHYWYEDWIYQNKIDLHLTHSDMDLLYRVEREEVERGEQFVRELIFFEDGTLGASWVKGLKRLN